jgi:hypothetical protein
MCSNVRPTDDILAVQLPPHVVDKCNNLRTVWPLSIPADVEALYRRNPARYKFQYQVHVYSTKYPEDWKQLKRVLQECSDAYDEYMTYYTEYVEFICLLEDAPVRSRTLLEMYKELRSRIKVALVLANSEYPKVANEFVSPTRSKKCRPPVPSS